MSVQAYLPSTQYSVLLGSLLLSGGLVYAAAHLTAPPKTSAPSVVSDAGSAKTSNTDWEATLYAIQAEEGSSSLPTPPDQSTVDALRAAAQTKNVTDSVGRTLLVNLENAQAQGLGSDIPTQNQLIASAESLLPAQPTKVYTKDNLTVIADSPETQRAYGNAVAALIGKYAARGDVDGTLVAIGHATDNNDPAPLQDLKPAEADYRALVQELLTIAVPQTFEPFHLELVNDFSQIADTYPDMETIVGDPLRGLTGLQKYQSLGDEIGRVFINMAQAFSKDAILWNKDESGSYWSSILSAQS